MQILNAVAVGLALLFLVPGYIIHSLISSLTVRRHDDTQLLALRFLTYSAINAFLCAPLLMCLRRDYPHHIYNWKAWLITCLVLFIIPTAIGILIGRIEDQDILRTMFSRCGLGLLHPSPSGWDTQFQYLTKKKISAIVIVTLKDGRKVYGYYGNVSIASSDSAERDLYLQTTYSVNDTDKSLTPQPGGLGILIAGTEIGSIEFVEEQNA